MDYYLADRAHLAGLNHAVHPHVQDPPLIDSPAFEDPRPPVHRIRHNPFRQGFALEQTGRGYHIWSGTLQAGSKLQEEFRLFAPARRLLFLLQMQKGPMPAMKLTALIVDDEQPARDELAFLLKGFPDVEVVAQGKNGPEAIGMIRALEPQLVFLDVQMPGLDGFGVIKKLLEKKARLPFVIFVTAYDQYAVQAFEVNAMDYLLKPIAKARLEKALAKVRRGVEAA